ncbi:hypothetical protein ZOSMA_178G00060 [Zostera marina]|uniref:DUF538 family protein n=1 Tax=Zostera marina TaxID=29655 RepID=A0A0K9PRF1_ZOSMR|nr:hypothetical protein ZOSMA_178G00060 [Zostera marina]
MEGKIIFLFSILLLSVVSHSQNFDHKSAYDQLQTNGFPVGLLPENVVGYSLNTTTGDFVLNLDDHCQITLPPDNYLASYSTKITGKLLDRRIKELNGIRVRAFFQWWSITGIKSTEDDLVFEVGIASAKYKSKNFGAIPFCEGRKPRVASV